MKERRKKENENTKKGREILKTKTEKRGVVQENTIGKNRRRRRMERIKGKAINRIKFRGR